MMYIKLCHYNTVIEIKVNVVKHGQAPARGNQALLATDSKYNTNNHRNITTQQVIMTITVTLPKGLESVKYNLLILYIYQLSTS